MSGGRKGEERANSFGEPKLFARFLRYFLHSGAGAHCAPLRRMVRVL